MCHTEIAKLALSSCSGAPAGSTAIIEGNSAAVPEEIGTSIEYFMFQGRMIRDMETPVTRPNERA